MLEMLGVVNNQDRFRGDDRDGPCIDVSQRAELSLHAAVQPVCSSVAFCIRTLALSFCIIIMASRRTCLGLLRRGDAFTKKSSASSNLRTFSNPSYWSTRRVQDAKRISLWSQSSRSPLATSQILRHSKQFSSSPAPRHGHLDAPKPGEEYVD